jgi:hypothetical protein
MSDRPDPDPPLEIITGSGGRLVVASDALLAQVDSLGNLSEQLRLSAGELLGIMNRTDDAPSIANDIPLAAADARRMMDAALRELMAAQARASNIRNGVLHSIESYARAERAAGAALHLVNEQLAWLVGGIVRVAALPLAVFAVEGWAMGLMFGSSPSDVGVGLQTILRAHGRILTNPFTVAAIRETAADVDGFSAGFLGLPPGIADTLESNGITGVPTSAAEVIALGNVGGLLVETPVSVRKTSSFEFGAPPRSLVDRASSFPDPHNDPNGEQIRIDRYVEPGKPDRFDIYVAGTVTFDPKATTQPFDFTSDMAGVAGQSPGSLRAVEQAMAQAGVTSSSPVVLNGYSQGGLVASMVAASGNYNVKGVVTFGAPSGQVHIPASIPVLSVRNSEDLVPATSGYDVNPNALVVQRPVFAHSPVPSDWAVPAHRLSYYQETAAVVDRAQSSQVRSILDPLNSFGAGARHVDSTLWVATRTTAGLNGGSLPAREAVAG